MAKHACLSASASARWLNCPPSAKLCAEAGERASPYAREGTLAHELCQYLLEKELGRPHGEEPQGCDTEMREYAEGYRDFVLERMAAVKSPLVCVEQRLDFSRWVPQGFGTGDCIIVADGVLHVIDFKYGVGILVAAANNPQLKCYALGAVDTFGNLYDIEEIRLSIYQPRRANVDTVSLTKGELLKWADEILAPTAKLAYEGKGDFRAGDHCRFCLAKAACRERAEYALELAKYDFAKPATLGAEEIADVLGKADALASWAEDVKAYALAQALQGTRYPGFKLVEGRSNRRYTDETKVAEAVAGAGYEPYEKKLLGITAMQRSLGKKKFEELLGGLVIKPEGKPVLVSASDKRPEYHTAADDFKEENLS